MVVKTALVINGRQGNSFKLDCGEGLGGKQLWVNKACDGSRCHI